MSKSPTPESQPGCFENLRPIEIDGFQIHWPRAEAGLKTDFGRFSFEIVTGNCVPFLPLSGSNIKWYEVVTVSVDWNTSLPDQFQVSSGAIGQFFESIKRDPNFIVSDSNGFKVTVAREGNSLEIHSFFRFDRDVVYFGNCWRALSAPVGRTARSCRVTRYSINLPVMVKIHFEGEKLDLVEARFSYVDALLAAWKDAQGGN